MVKYAYALTLVLLSSSGARAIKPRPSSAFIHPSHKHQRIRNSNDFVVEVSAIAYDDGASNDGGEGIEKILPTVISSIDSTTSTLLDSIALDDQEEVDELLARKEERRAARLRRVRKPNYQITLPLGGVVNNRINNPPTTAAQRTFFGENDKEELASLVARGQEIAVANTIGMSLRQVYSGRKLSELALDVDTLRFQSFVDELQGRRVEGEEFGAGAVEDGGDNNAIQSVQVLQNSALEILAESFDGVVVSSVTQGGLAWKSGVRAGDVLTATSATIGGKLWPKSTLDGVRSAISSRKVISSTMDFEFKRTGVSTEDVDGVGTEVVKTFELSLSRPIGINVEDTEDGFVTITGISDKAAAIVQDTLSVGDRVVSVESSVGSKMWDVYSTDGLTSAVTSRLPGQPVRMIFERVESVDEVDAAVGATEQPTSMSNAVSGFRQAGKTAEAAATSAVAATPSVQTAAQKMLLSRSRDLLRTYIARNEVKNVKVADRVLDAVIDAEAVLDGKTLNLIMKAYNICGSAEKTIETFEEVFGVAGDGSDRAVRKAHGGKLAADITALNKFTISSLLVAHAVRADYDSAVRVLAAMEGNSEAVINGKKSHSWSGKGDPLNMYPDTRCYNTALAAAAKKETQEGLQAAIGIFDSMPDPSIDNPPWGKPAKNLVTFNTMIDAFARMGQYQNANDVFQSLKKSKLRPDLVSYTTLIKASIKSGDIDKALDLLDDMKWIGIQPDIVSYNNIIESLCNANRLFEAKDLVNEMEMTRVSPDSMTYGLLMTGLLKANKPGPCLTLFESACSDQRTTALTENVYLYTTAISAAAALGDHERALDLVSRMNQAGVKPNKKTLTALMGACINGKKYEAAVNIFSKIKNPDSHAISVGLDALCLAGKFDTALELITEQRSGQVTLKGKQVMAGYTKLIQEALLAKEYNVARDALNGLLRAGYIPSKFTFAAMKEGLVLQSDMPFTSAAMMQVSESTPSIEKFQFLLFVLDSLESRKLTVDPTFYSSVLVTGALAGGLPKRIAALIARSRKIGAQKELETGDSTDESLPNNKITSWEDLLENYSTHKAEKEKMGPGVVFPSVRVSTKKSYGRVLAAEQAVALRGTKGNRS